MFAGGALLLVSTFVILKNERSAVHTAEGLDSGLKNAISVSSPEEKNNRQLVHVTGSLSASDSITDAQTGLQTMAVFLQRNVSVLQWKEKAETVKKAQNDGSNKLEKVYSYEKIWSDTPVDSSTFHNPKFKNPPFPVQNKIWNAKRVALGEFMLHEDLVHKTPGKTAMEFTQTEINSISSGTVKDNAILLSKTPGKPQAGDARITYTIIRPAIYSIIAAQNGNLLQSYVEQNGSRLGLIQKGEKNIAEMIGYAHKQNSFLAWIVRFLAMLGMKAGLSLVFIPVSRMGKALPVFGTIAASSVSIFTTTLAIALSLVVISLAWVWQRPLLSLLLLAFAVAGFVYLKMKSFPKEKSI